MPGISRREALELGIISAATLGFAPIPVRAADPIVTEAVADGEVVSDARPRNIIFMVADGMSVGVPTLTEPFAQRLRGRGTVWWPLLARPDVTHGYFETGSLLSMVTDSSAGSCAWSTGSRVVNGALNMFPDGTKLTPIAPLMKSVGKRVGLVTTTQITHATPAGFAAVAPSRNHHAEIGPQYKDTVDVLMGGGIEHWSPDRRADKRDLIGEFKAAGYTFCDHRSQLPTTAPDKLLGLFNSGQMPYTIDWQHQSEIQARVPSLVEMTRTALRSLERGEQGFLLQIEGGRVDHAAHANDAGAILWDQLAFDDAIAEVLDFAAKRDDTLVIVTSDHGNANPGLNGTGGGYRRTNKAFDQLFNMRASYETMNRTWAARRVEDGEVTREAAVEVVRESTGIELAGKEAAVLHKALNGDFSGEVFKQHRSWVGVLGQVLGNHHSIGWTGVSHTADLVWVTAFGPGSEHFRGVHKNTFAFNVLCSLTGITHRNPTMTPEKAAELVLAQPEEEPVWA